MLRCTAVLLPPERLGYLGDHGDFPAGVNRLLAYDDFDEGLNGWTELTGNYRPGTMAVVPGHEPFTDLRPPMLSSAM